MIKNLFLIFCFLIFVNNSNAQNYWNSGSWNWNNPYWQWKPIQQYPLYNLNYSRTYNNVYPNIYIIYINPYYNLGQRSYYQSTLPQKTSSFR